VTQERPHDIQELDAIVVGAGFAGLHALHHLRTAGFHARVLEAGAGVGGVWFWNRYPGARCDVESADYSYSFSPELEQEWTWSERFASQPEIERYLNFVADTFDLHHYIDLNTRVSRVVYDDSTGRWLVTTAQGRQFVARYCIMATGMLSEFNRPSIDGSGDFAGEQYDTGRWPAEPVQLDGRRVAVIGTGSTGIQLITEIAPVVEHLVVFQRTPNFSLPGANRPLTTQDVDELKATYADRRRRARDSPTGNVIDPNPKSALEDDDAGRQREFESRWGNGAFSVLFSYTDLMVDPEANAALTEFMQSKIRERVTDAAVAADLVPTNHPAGSKRMCVDNGYYETFNRDNVTLVNIRRTPILQITEAGIRTTERDYDVDLIVYATGFDAMTGALSKIDIRGREGRRLSDAWEAGPDAYLGLMVAGFPNLFLVTGPGSPSVLSNVVHSAEQHVNWIGDCLEYMRVRGYNTIEASPAAQAEWVAHVRDVANSTLYVKADSWYLGSNIPGKPRTFMAYLAGTNTYRGICDDVAADDYRGFVLRSLVGINGGADE
jgi:cation diffusion facilitator CzcD-associated flavoprotein CzcO